MVHDHHGKGPDPPGSAQVSQKTFHASSTYNIKPAFSYYGSLVMGYSRCQIVAPPIADLSLCLRTNRGGPPGSVDRMASMLLCQLNVQIYWPFCALPGTPSRSCHLEPTWG